MQEMSVFSCHIKTNHAFDPVPIEVSPMEEVQGVYKQVYECELGTS